MAVSLEVERPEVFEDQSRLRGWIGDESNGFAIGEEKKRRPRLPDPETEARLEIPAWTE